MLEIRGPWAEGVSVPFLITATGFDKMTLRKGCLCSSWLFDIGLRASTGHRLGFALTGLLEGCCLPSSSPQVKLMLQTLWLGEKENGSKGLDGFR